MKIDRYNFVPYTIFAGFIAVGMVVLIALVNDVLATKTVLETWPGTKSVCTRQEWNYSLKVTQCKAYANVPATCNKIESVGPIFGPIIHTECN
jgi:hypothetical protein